MLATHFSLSLSERVAALSGRVKGEPALLEHVQMSSRAGGRAGRRGISQAALQ
jgi:hypothetical protein